MTKPRSIPSLQELRDNYHYCPDTGEFSQRVDGSPIGLRIFYDRKGYARINIFRHPYQVHRLAWYYVNGEWPSLQIDHINGVKDDNRICNLRLATCGQNNANKFLTIRNSSGAKGVSWNRRKKKWQVFIRHNGRNKNLGYYNDIDTAKVAYKVAAKIVHGEFANTGEHP